MILSQSFEIVNFADERIAVPTGEKALSFKGVVALSETAAFLLSNMHEEKTREELLELLMKHYSVDRNTAKEDLDKWIIDVVDIGLIDM